MVREMMRWIYNGMLYKTTTKKPDQQNQNNKKSEINMQPIEDQVQFWSLFSLTLLWKGLHIL